jgi:hypothetical protein
MPTVVEQSPQWWLLNLYRRLLGRLPEIRRYEDYYEGRHRLNFVTSEYREEFGKMLAGVTDNWMALVVDAVEERLHVDGFRIPDDSGEGQADKSAWTTWQRNCLDADSELVHQIALQAGSAYAMVWYGAEDTAEITAEHPSQTIIAYAGGSRRERLAALKTWTDEWTGAVRANVYMPDGIYKFESSKVPAPTDYVTPSGRARDLGLVWDRTWSVSSEDDGFVENPLGVVPIVEFRNRPRMLGVGRSEIADVISTQDQINKLVCDMLVAAEFSAFRQRWATGVEVPTDPVTGKELDDSFAAAVNRLWSVPSDAARFGEFGETDLGNYVKAIENRVQSLASRTRTPPHYLLGQSGSFPSGESLKATETGLIAKVRSRQRHFGEAWEEVMRLSFMVQDESAAAEQYSSETIWADPESRSESEHVDALIKLRGLQVPLKQLWEDAGYTPPQIERFDGMLIGEALNRIMSGQPAAPQPSAMAEPLVEV